jgi:branched-chain amino acid transport system permease protein
MPFDPRLAAAKLREPRARRIALGSIALAALVFPFVGSAYLVDVGFFFGVYALLGLSLNIVLGEVGLYDLGHAGFFAIGAYVTAILNTRLGVPVLALLPVSGLAAALFAFLVCLPIIHLRGDYLCIVTIGMGEIVRLALVNNPFGLTGGPNGVYGIERPRIGRLLVIDSSPEFYFLIWGLVGLAAAGLLSLQRSRIGRAWNCIREDEVAARASGIDTRSYKMLAFVLGAFLAGVAGNVYAAKLMIVSPESFTFWESCLMFSIVLIGGMGSLPGVIIGAGVVSLFPEVFRAFSLYRMVVFGLAMILMMVFRPGGLWPRRRLATAAAAPAAPAAPAATGRGKSARG